MAGQRAVIGVLAQDPLVEERVQGTHAERHRLHCAHEALRRKALAGDEAEFRRESGPRLRQPLAATLAPVECPAGH